MMAQRVDNPAAGRHASNPHETPWLHRFAVFLVFGVLFLITAGGMVTSTGSGLSVPDWPTTYGHNMFAFPYAKWVGGIYYEHGHRLVATTIGMLTIVLAIWIQCVEPRRWLRRLGWVALLVVIAQGILGGLTVHYLLPTWISVFHACLAQTFFCIIVSIAVVTSSAWKRRTPQTMIECSSSVRRWAVAMVAVVFLQLFLGALMRHTDAGLAVPDFPLAYDQVLPGLSDADIAAYNDHRGFDLNIPPVTREQVLVHLIHRAGAVLVTLVFAAGVVLSWRKHFAHDAIRRPILIIAGLLVIQIALGAYTVLSQRNPWVATAHVATGAAVLGVCWLNVLAIHRSTRVAAAREVALETSAILGGATA